MDDPLNIGRELEDFLVARQAAMRPECTCRERDHQEAEIEKLRALVRQLDDSNERLHESLEARDQGYDRGRVAGMNQAIGVCITLGAEALGNRDECPPDSDEFELWTETNEACDRCATAIRKIVARLVLAPGDARPTKATEP